MGVVDAFHGIGVAGGGSLKAVAPGIAEALITTAAGLFVAVPAVVAYNQFTARIRVFAAAIDDFCRELLNSLEEIPVRTADAAGAGELAGPAELAIRTEWPTQAGCMNDVLYQGTSLLVPKKVEKQGVLAPERRLLNRPLVVGSNSGVRTWHSRP